MADTSRMTELDAREAEAEEARARLAETLGTLTSPETQQAVKAEMMRHLESYKDELLRQGEKYKDELLSRADEYKGEFMDRAEQYKGEFLSRADVYKDEFLQRADDYKNELLERARDSGKETMHSVADDLKQRAMANPLAVALIGAGIGWRLYKHPPITTLLVGAGVGLLMRSPGNSAQQERKEYSYGYNEYGYPVMEEARAPSMTEQMMSRAGEMGEAARETIEHARSVAASAAEDAYERFGSAGQAVRQSPLLAGLLSLAAGTLLARTIRGTETGERIVQSGSDMIGRGARGMVSRVGDAASYATRSVSGAMSSPRESAEPATTPRRSNRASERRMRQKTHRHRQMSRATQEPGREIVELAERYPLLAGSLGLAIGAAVGAMLRSTAAEDRYVGATSDALKRRVQDKVSDQFGQAADVADRMVSSVEDRLRRRGSDARPDMPDTRKEASRHEPERAPPGTGSAGDVDETSVVVERAKDAAQAKAAVGGKKRGE